MTFSNTHSFLFCNFNLLLNTQVTQGPGKTGKKKTRKSKILSFNVYICPFRVVSE